VPEQSEPEHSEPTLTGVELKPASMAPLAVFCTCAVCPAWLRGTQSQRRPLAQFCTCCAKVTPGRRWHMSAWPSTSVARVCALRASMSSTVPRTPIEAVGVEIS
jgi:hypothetical protein